GQGQTLLDNLRAVATEPLDRELATAQGGFAAVPGSFGNGSASARQSRAQSEDVARDVLLESLIDEVGKPRLVDQSSFGTCVPTSMQYGLVQEQPAEYARLIRGLVGTGAKAEMQGGGTLQTQREYLSQGTREVD